MNQFYSLRWCLKSRQFLNLCSKNLSSYSVTAEKSMGSRPSSSIIFTNKYLKNSASGPVKCIGPTRIFNLKRTLVSGPKLEISMDNYGLKNLFRIFTRNYHIAERLNTETAKYSSFKTFTRTYCIAEKFSLDHDPLKTYIKRLLEEYKTLNCQMTNIETYNEKTRVEIYKRHSELYHLAERLKKIEKLREENREIAKMVAGLCPDDREMRKMAAEDMESLQEQIEELKHEVLLMLVPPARADDSDIILEVSAGVGGQEAMLFTADIFNMYKNYSQYRGWKIDLIEYNTTDLGGLRNASCTISGAGVFKFLKYESGIHRVQRVPATEKSGRIHTSTVSVAILPTPSEIDIVINPQELKIDTFRASGKGGQHINTTDSAVRITHTPTNTVVECQTERSQIKNRETALKILRSRLYQRQLERAESLQRSQRKLQVGSADRSDKIRTYNFQQDRITDHRVKVNVSNVKEFLSGGTELNDMVEILQEESRAESLMELLENFASET